MDIKATDIYVRENMSSKSCMKYIFVCLSVSCFCVFQALRVQMLSVYYHFFFTTLVISFILFTVHVYVETITHIHTHTRGQLTRHVIVSDINKLLEISIYL